MNEDAFLQQYMRDFAGLNQDNIAFNPFKFFGGNPLEQSDKLREGTLTEDEIDTGLGVGDAILQRRLRQKQMMEQLGL